MGDGYSCNRTGQPTLANRAPIGYATLMLDLIVSLMMLAVLVLFAGAVFLWRRGDGNRASLMALLAVVISVNVVIWLAPTESGETLAGSVAE